MPKIILSLLIILLAGSGCETTHYRMLPPSSSTGRLCVTQCAGIREMCVSQEKQSAYYEREQCERRRDRDYHRCMDRAGDERDRRKKCEQNRDSCSSYANTTRCETDYRGCFSNCGGRVVREVEEW